MSDTLYSLKEAAERLGVHPVTLRRWAESGKIRAVRTPGGHRRFSEEEIKRLTSRPASEESDGIGESLREKALSYTRQDIPQHEGAWISDISEKERKEKRLLGRRLMGLMIQYVGSQEENADEILDEARTIARLYAKGVVMSGLPLQEALKAVNFFRDHILESAVLLPEAARRQPEANQRMFRKLNAFLNEVQLQIADCYDALGPATEAAEDHS
ncbi:MAG: helix-turn-helix domain-containing protein [Bacteroidota bacterium]|nr:helix-turn-helix domain-containing protein [Bacteroidota bacterium]